MIKNAVDRENQRIYQMEYFKNNPWARTLNNIRTRTADKKNRKYGGKGIKCRITLQELKELWFRDKAFLMKRPSIDRIDSDKDYIFGNCRYLELEENSLDGRRKMMRKVARITIDGKIIKKYESASEGAKEFNGCRGPINSCVRGKYKTAYGFKWIYID